MPPFLDSYRMETAQASPPSSAVAGPAPLWRLAERRSRKTGSGNIFSNVNLWQLQNLFKSAGDQDAEQRAQLVWGHRNEAELAQALVGLRTRSHRRGPRVTGKDTLGTHWLRAFNHLRIGENLPSSQGRGPEEQSDAGAGVHNVTEPSAHTSVGMTGRFTAAAVGPRKGQGSSETSERPARTGSGLRRGGENDPERYLHRILH